MRFLSGVVLHHIGPTLDAAMDLVDEVYWDLLGHDLTITSCRDGNHSENSKHYYRPHDAERWPSNPHGSQGAFDCRTWPRPNVPGQWLPAKRAKMAEAIRARLEVSYPGEFWTLAEKTHIHVQHRGAA